MDDLTFDRVARLFGRGSRRAALRTAWAFGAFSLLGATSEAKKRRKPKKRKCKKSRPHRCGKQCVNRRTDSRHCGACGNRCAEGETCRDGVCTCGDGMVVCGGACQPGNCCAGDAAVTCTDVTPCCTPDGCQPLGTTKHCSACNDACDSDDACVEGECGCPEGWIVCGGACQQGNCCDGDAAVTCNVGSTCCAPDGCQTLDTPEQCGQCGRSCLPGEACVGGECICPSGHVICGGACVAGNCCDGDAGVTCQDGESCCAPNGCLKLDTIDHCGQCGLVCAETTDSCVAGSCVCGDLGAPCGEGAICDRGACICPAEQIEPGDCGECGITCPDDRPCDQDAGRCSCKDTEIYFQSTCVACPPPPPEIGLPGSDTVMACGVGSGDEYCSCGGECCGTADDCFVTYNDRMEPVSEFCCTAAKGTVCGNECCSNRNCAESGVCVRINLRGGSYRRPGR